MGNPLSDNAQPYKTDLTDLNTDTPPYIPQSSPQKSDKKLCGVWLPIMLCWLVYATAYVGRYGYSSNINAIIDHNGISNAKAGLVGTCFFFVYGAGQIVNGIFSRRYNKRIIIPSALFISAACNLIIFLRVPFVAYKYLWAINGASQSVLWSSLICLLAETLAPSDIPKATIAMSTCVATGTFISYGISSLEAYIGGNAYLYSFLIGSAVMAAAAVLWILFYSKAFKPRYVKDVETITDGKTAENNEDKLNKDGRKAKRVYDKALIMMVGVFCLLAITDNLIKDGLNTWVPRILKEKFGLNDGLSVLLSLVLPLLGMLGAVMVAVMTKVIKSFVSILAIWFTASALLIGVVILLGGTSLWIIVLLAFGLISLSMHAINNVITSVAPLKLHDKINSGLMSGLVNGFCYVGSTISSYGLGAVADDHGWNGVFYLLFAISVASALIAVAFEIVVKISGSKKGKAQSAEKEQKQ